MFSSRPSTAMVVPRSRSTETFRWVGLLRPRTERAGSVSYTVFIQADEPMTVVTSSGRIDFFRRDIQALLLSRLVLAKSGTYSVLKGVFRTQLHATPL